MSNYVFFSLKNTSEKTEMLLKENFLMPTSKGNLVLLKWFFFYYYHIRWETISYPVKYKNQNQNKK